jgi:hypothetical protein
MSSTKQLVNDLVALLSSPTFSLENALMNAQVLAHRLQEVQLATWVRSELRGYEPGADIPPYRVIRPNVVGTITNGYYRYTNRKLPLSHLEEAIRQSLETTKVTQSISAIASLAEKDGQLTAPIAPELLGLFGEAIDGDYWVEDATKQFSTANMRNILAEVKSRLLQFALDLSDRITEETDTQVAQGNHSATYATREVFRNAVFGPNATVIIGNNNTTHIRNSVVQNDLDSLLSALRSAGVGEPDLEELKTAVAADSSTRPATGIGERVRSWIGNMVSKAGSAAWNISIETAGSVLAAAILAYYGLSS